ncbi:MAG TPA: FISUMP domain-containing protein [Bacteroidales bacterium]
MKKINVLIAAILMIASFSLTAQVAISTGGGSADASAMLDVQSTAKGLLPPRMTSAQMNAIPSPAAGLIVYCTDCASKAPHFFNGTSWINMIYGSAVGTTDVYSSATGKIWMDRNLGATQVATSSTDADSYGYLYQWGRLTDGHQIRASLTTTDLSATDVPGHGNFIRASGGDWRSPQNDNLWQGLSGTNNPCPAGYRIPTETELDAERASWISSDAAGAFASVLKLTVGGNRNYSTAVIANAGVNGHYWTSTISATSSKGLNFTSSSAVFNASGRAYGFSIRCIKD